MSDYFQWLVLSSQYGSTVSNYPGSIQTMTYITSMGTNFIYGAAKADVVISVKKAADSALAWLDKRVDELRVKL